MSESFAFHRLVLAGAAMLVAVGIAMAAELPDCAAGARRDLARRLGIPATQVEVVQYEAKTFPDASLGLSRPGEMYAQVLTPGYSVVLKARHTEYLYAATDRFVRYGGPLDSWRSSALYIEPTPNEPNLNGNLYQVSLAGTNPRLLLESVDQVWPQVNGDILATRRTSRSGYDLLRIAPDGQSNVIASALYFAQATVNEAGDQWAAALRPGLGSGWVMSWGPFKGDSEQRSALELPDGAMPVRVYWGSGQPTVVVRTGDRQTAYRPNAEGTDWEPSDVYLPAEHGETLLNKSESLDIRTDEVNGKPAAVVVRRWFTGDEKPVATIPGITVDSFCISPEQRFVLISGHDAEDHTYAYTVDIRTGEVLRTARGMNGAAVLYAMPPVAWLQFGAVQVSPAK